MGPTEFQKLPSNGLDVFVNISNSVNNQRLKFDVLAVLDLLNKTTGSDLTCGAQKRSDFEKNGLPYINVQVHYSSAFQWVCGFRKSEGGSSDWGYPWEHGFMDSLMHFSLHCQTWKSTKSQKIQEKSSERKLAKRPLREQTLFSSSYHEWAFERFTRYT